MKPEIHINNKNKVRTSQQTHYFSITKSYRIMAYRNITGIYSESHMEHVNKLTGQKAKSLNDKAGRTNTNNCVKN